MTSGTCEMIVIGASVGGLAAIEHITRDLPPDFPIPIVAVLHLKQDLKTDYLGYFHRLKMQVCEATEKQTPVAGHFYVAPPGYHLLLETDGTFALSVEERINYARPSVDLFFETAAEVVGNRLVGIILTGANYDGAKGLKAIKDVGGLCFVQDPKEAEGKAMPEAAMKLIQADQIVDLDHMAQLIATLGIESNPRTTPGRASGDRSHV